MKAKTPARKVTRRPATKTAGRTAVARTSSPRRKTAKAAAVTPARAKPAKRKTATRTTALETPSPRRKTAPLETAPAPAVAGPALSASVPATTPAVTAAIATPAAKPRAARKKVARQPKLKIPPILLEGDRPASPLVSGPGQRYVLGPTPPVEKFVSDEAQLPEAYGTKRLFLAARDPQWLYAHWDLTREQQRQCNLRSADGHLVLRIYVDRVAGAPFVEMHVHPESRHWFVHVGRGGTKYLAELGYYRRRGGRWTRVSVSEATLTPQEALAEGTETEFATIPPELPLPKLVALVRQAALSHAPLAVAIEELRAAGHPALPRIVGQQQPSAPWTPEQERALAELINLDAVRRIWISSLEITELVRRQHLRQLASPAGAAFGLPTSPGGAVTSVSSPFGGEPPGAKGFWFNVNAELIVYGATEPDATVTIGGRPIKLRPDGSFSCRFALPDGCYELPAVAVSADQTDGRAAELRFRRETAYRGDVGTHPQDPGLKPPTPENV